jgi:antitoxin (DNA-binding transcriptional repressor) of toxin-antitoxin stability system
MEERRMGLDAARPKLGELAADAGLRGVVTILTSHGHPLARIVPLETDDDKRWNDAVDWLLNSVYTAEPGAQAAFWGIAEGSCTRDNAENWVSEGGGVEYG